MPKKSREVAIFEAAVNASGLSVYAFGRKVLGVHERTARRYKQGELTLDGPALRLCLLYAGGSVSGRAHARLLEDLEELGA